MKLIMLKKNRTYNIFLITVFVFSLTANCFGFDLGEKVLKAKLKNGLTVLMLERHISPTVALYIRHRVGAVDEKKYCWKKLNA
jgi:hypothetical protein